MEALALQAARIEEDAVLSAKGHFEAVQRRAAVHRALGVPVASLAAVGGASAVKDGDWAAAVIAVVVAGATAAVWPSERSPRPSAK